jgi:hypothetical protein
MAQTTTCIGPLFVNVSMPSTPMKQGGPCETAIAQVGFRPKLIKDEDRSAQFLPLLF